MLRGLGQALEELKAKQPLLNATFLTGKNVLNLQKLFTVTKRSTECVTDLDKLNLVKLGCVGLPQKILLTLKVTRK